MLFSGLSLHSQIQLGNPITPRDHDSIWDPHPHPQSLPTSFLGLHNLSLKPARTWHDRMRNWEPATGDGRGRQSLLVPITNGRLSERNLGKDTAPEGLSLVDFKIFRCTLV